MKFIVRGFVAVVSRGPLVVVPITPVLAGVLGSFASQVGPGNGPSGRHICDARLDEGARALGW